MCSIQDPYDGTLFDLTILSNNSYVMDTSGKFIIGLCGKIKNVRFDDLHVHVKADLLYDIRPVYRKFLIKSVDILTHAFP